VDNAVQPARLGKRETRASVDNKNEETWVRTKDRGYILEEDE
jgi:hypothetical protein